MNQEPGAEPDEPQLLARARRGDRSAFAAIYRAHARAIHALALRLTADPAAAEDVTQETFLKALQGLAGFRGESSLRSWLKRLTANAAIDRLRAQTRLQALDDFDALEGPGGSAGDTAEALGLLLRLPPLARTVVWLHEMEGWSHPELAARFGRSESWSKSVLARALTRLRAELEQDEART